MEPTNRERAARAEYLLRAYPDVAGGDMVDDQTTLCDVLADLMHFAAQHARDEDCPTSFKRALQMAEIHFDSERDA